MKLYGYEVNTCNYKQFSTGQLDESKAEELLALIEHEIKVRDKNN